MSEFSDTMRNLGSTRLMFMAVVAIAIITFFIFLVTRLTTPELDLLYGNLDSNDAGAIVGELENQNIDYQVSEAGNNTRIFVPHDQVSRLRMLLAQQNIPNSGTIGYEIFDQNQGFGTTNFMQNMNRLRGLEGELTRTLMGYNKIRAARVHIVMPERQQFTRQTQEATASVTLTLQGSLNRDQITGIENLIANSVPGLEASRVTILDTSGNMLASGTGQNSESTAATIERRRAEREDQLKQAVENILMPIVGDFSAMRVTIAADIDFDRITTNEEQFDPEGQVLRSLQTSEQESSTSGGGAGAVTVSNNIPGGSVDSSSGGGGINSETTAEETRNFEISHLQRTHIREGGLIRSLSAAILVDNVRIQNPDDPEAAPEIRPRTEEELAQIEELVKTAIGYNAERGDQVVVSSMAFNTPVIAPLEEETSGLPFGLRTEDIRKLAELLILAIIAIFVLLLIVKPLVNKAMEMPVGGGLGAQNSGAGGMFNFDSSLPQMAAAAGGGGGGNAPPPMPAMPNMDASNVGSPDAPSLNIAPVDPKNTEIEAMINLSQVEGRVRASSVKQIEEIVNKHPDEAVSIVRNWMQHEDK